MGQDFDRAGRLKRLLGPSFRGKGICLKAVYVFEAQPGTTNDTVTFTGNARVENAQGWLTGEPIYWDRANNHLRADNPKMIWRQNFNGAGAETKSPADNTNNLSAPK